MKYAFIIGDHDPASHKIRILDVPEMPESSQCEDFHSWASWWYVNKYDLFSMLHSACPAEVIEADAPEDINVVGIKKCFHEILMNSFDNNIPFEKVWELDPID